MHMHRFYGEVAAIALLLATFALGIAIARREGFFAPAQTERFFEESQQQKVIQSLRGSRYKIDVVDAAGHDMGRCLLLDGRRQFCEADEHRYHEMLVHFPCAFLGHERPTRALIVHGGDCMTLREVLKYVDTLEQIVVIEEDERVVEMCERHLSARSLRSGDNRVRWLVAAPAAESIARLAAAGNENLQGFDLLVVDGKDRPGAQLSKDALKDLRLLLSPDGVIACSGASASAFDGTLPHKVSFSFFSPTHDAQTRMNVYARFDFAARELDAERHAERVGARFFDAGAVWDYVPWFLRPGGGGGGKPTTAS